MPITSQFEPVNAERGYNIVNIFIEEFEAVRLVDFMGMNQVEASIRMGISQKTLWNDLTSARWKIADAIVNGKKIQIGGGSYILHGRINKTARE